jgi:hypothetical protein
MHCLRPASVSVEQLLARTLQEVTYGSLSDAILEMHVYPTKDELLSCIMACLAECVVVEMPVVTVVVEDFYSVLCSKLFKAILAAIVSSDAVLSWRWMKGRWLKWSLMTVATM